MEPAVLRALERTLAGMDAADPARGPLLVHLAGLVLRAGEAEQALHHAVAALGIDPSDTAALSVAAAAANALGREPLADSYRRTHAALLSDQPSPAAPGTRPEDAADAPEAFEASDHPGALRPSERVSSDSDWDIPGRPAVTLADVAGMDDVKRRLHRSFLGPMREPALRQAFGKQLRGGLLLWGAPGTGKTFLARALSGEIGARFVSATPADVYGGYFGESEQNVARLFTSARRRAPSVVFLDELDAIGGRRSRRTTDQARAVVNQLLLELDGMSHNDGVYVLAATNAPWDVDDALRRPGRFDRTVLVLPPDAPARRAILASQLSTRPTTADMELPDLVRRTVGYSGADLVRLVEAAAERALDRSIASGGVSPLSAEDLAGALADTPPSTRQWFSTAANYAAYAADDAEVDELMTYLRQHRLL